MRKKLFALTMVAILIGTLSASVFAAEPQKAPDAKTTDATMIGVGEEVQLGDILFANLVAFDPATNVILRNWPVGIYLWRPNTVGGYDWFDNTFEDATQFVAPMYASGAYEHRQTWPTYAMSDPNGFYYAKFMLPRDEAWYPCSYPCKWKCNVYDVWQGAYTEVHSPAEITFVYPYKPVAAAFWAMTHYPLFWPWDWNWLDPFQGFVNPYWWVDAGAAPFDTVHPLWILAVEEVSGSVFYMEEEKVMGYFWQPSDLEIEYPADWPYICGDDWQWF